MRILHINTYDRGGAFNAAYRIFQCQKELNCDTHFLCLRNSKDHSDVSYYQSKISYPISRKVLWKFKIPFTHEHSQILKSKKYKNKIERYSVLESDYSIEESQLFKNADIIHFHWINGFINPMKFKRSGKIIVWTFHDLNPILGNAHYESDQDFLDIIEHDHQLYVKEQRRNFIERVEPSIVSPSIWLKEKAQEKFNCSYTKNIQVIPYGINLDSFKQIVKPKNNEKKNILIVAENIEIKRKGYHFVERLIEEFHNSVNFLLVGILRKQNPKAKYIGYIESEEKMVELYNLADLVLIPSLEDNLPNVMVESLSCGTPVMAFPNGGMKDHINDSNGIIIKDFNFDSLNKSFKQFISNEVVFDRNEIRKYAESQFNKWLQTNNYLDLYRRLLEQGEDN